MKIELDLPEIEGYEYTGEYRYPRKNEAIYDDGLVIVRFDYDAEYPILKKKTPKYETILMPFGEKEDTKFVEIKALEDTLSFIDFHVWHETELVTINALKELLK